MATIFRDWSYRYQWLYDAISRLAALSVGGEAAPVLAVPVDGGLHQAERVKGFIKDRQEWTALY